MSRLVSLPPPTAFLFDSLRSKRFVQIHTVQFFDSPITCLSIKRNIFCSKGCAPTRKRQGAYDAPHFTYSSRRRSSRNSRKIGRTRCTFEPESEILLALTAVCFAYHCSNPTYPSPIHPLPTLPYLTLVRIVIR